MFAVCRTIKVEDARTKVNFQIFSKLSKTCKHWSLSKITAGNWFYLQNLDFLAEIFLGVKRSPEEGNPNEPNVTDGKLYVFHHHHSAFTSENVCHRILALFKKTRLSNNGRLHWKFLRHIHLLISDNCRCVLLPVPLSVRRGFPFSFEPLLYERSWDPSCWEDFLTAHKSVSQGRKNTQQKETCLPCSGRRRFSW